MLRTYQQRATNDLILSLRENQGGVCLEMPTGSGKSWVIGGLIKAVHSAQPQARVLMITHVRELIEQNAEKLKIIYPDADIGIYSAGLGSKEIRAITYGGIQSLRDKAAQLGKIDVVIVDECHLISHKEEGGYVKLINQLKITNPKLRVVGLTATPYRLGHGYLTDPWANKEPLFNKIIRPVSIEQLVKQKYLAPLRNKLGDTQYNISNVPTRGGEYSEGELETVVNTELLNTVICNEVIKKATDKQHWLLFCVGVLHAQAVRDKLIELGIEAACITGNHTNTERDDILNKFKDGKIKALTNVNVLTTGFDFPDIDLIALLRPTQSTSLYVQMVGRGMRLKSHTDHCLVLDFAGCIQRHGPVTQTDPKRKQAVTKKCPECLEIVDQDTKKCTACKYVFPLKEPTNNIKTCPECDTEVPKQTRICKAVVNDKVCGHVFNAPQNTSEQNADIMKKAEAVKHPIQWWAWDTHLSKAGNTMLKCKYYPDSIISKPIIEYFPILNHGYAAVMGWQKLDRITKQLQVVLPNFDYTKTDDSVYTIGYLDDICATMNPLQPPSYITTTKENNFVVVDSVIWENPYQKLIDGEPHPSFAGLTKACANCKDNIHVYLDGTCDYKEELSGSNWKHCNDWKESQEQIITSSENNLDDVPF